MVRKGGLEPRLGTGRITKSYQYLPSQPETKRKHLLTQLWKDLLTQMKGHRDHDEYLEALTLRNREVSRGK